MGVDVYGWLHPGTIPCAVDLALGKPTTKYVDYAMHRVRMLLHYGITPYIVFDGNYLPSKAGTELSRAASRAEAKRKGLDLLRMGKSAAAHMELQKAVDVTPEMARCLIEELKKLKVQYVVAPYEADAQLAFLERQGLIDGIVSEDSDMLVFGAKRLITKMDKFGECIEILRDDFTSCKTVSFFGWTDEMFRRMAILTGCDYLEGIPRLGLKTAHGLVRKYKDIERILRVLQFENKIRVPPGYLDLYRKAELTFSHQWVFDPTQQKLVMGLEWPEKDRPEDISFIGDDLEPDVACGVASGDIHPMTKQPMLFAQTPKRTGFNGAGKLPLQRRETIGTPSDLKSHKKPIDSFFKPKRTPLAELDPNIMTPSPTQLELLRRHSGTVLTTPVDENNATTQPLNTPATGNSAGSLRRHYTTGRIGTQSRTMSHPPPKRQRLCDDSPVKDKGLSLKSVETGASKFFRGSRLPDPSPSIQRHAKKKPARSSFDICSDASLEEAMLSLPDAGDLDGVTKTPRKLAIFQDTVSAEVAEEETGDSQEETQESITTRGTLSVTASMSSTATQDTAISLVPSTPPKLDKQRHKLENKVDRHDHGGLSQDYSADKRNKAPQAAERAAPRPSSRASTGSSALHRLGREALKRSRLTAGTNMELGAASKESTLPDLTAWTASSARAARISALCDAASASTSTQGSEDFFVPNSEDDVLEPDAEAEKEEACADESSRTLNVGRFAFAG